MSAALIWFDAFSRVVDSERVVYLFRFAPRTALLFQLCSVLFRVFQKRLRTSETQRRRFAAARRKRHKIAF